MSKSHTKIYGECYHQNTWSEEKPRNHFVPWRSCLDCGFSVAPWVGKYGTLDCSLTYEIALEICRDIRAGAYPHVAATKHVDYMTFLHWKARRETEFRVFHRMMDRAAAEARLEAEMIAKATDPKWWLKHGPGRKAPAELPDENWAEEKKQVEITGQIAHGHVHAFKPDVLDRLSVDELRILEGILSKGLLDVPESGPDARGIGESEPPRLLPASVDDSGTSEGTD